MKFDLIIKNGTVVTAVDTFKGDIGIREGKICAVGFKLESEGAEVIDAADRLVIPGGIDPHTHFDMPFGGSYTADDFETGTKAAAFGGTTTIIDFAIQTRGHSVFEGLETWHKKAEGKACIDYGFHMIISDVEGERLKDLSRLVDEGVPSYKLFMAYPGVLYVDDGTHYRAMCEAAESGAVVCMHAENGIVIDEIIKQVVKDGKHAPKYHGLSRSARMEAEAVHRTMAIAECAGAPIYIVHLTCAAALEEVVRSRQKGHPAFAETCAQYLYRSIEDYGEEGFEGAKYVMSPPLREKWNQDELWKGLHLGNLQATGSDHAPFNFVGQKDMGKECFTKIPNGAAVIENRVSLIYQGVVDGKITLNKFVEITSTGAAKIFGLFPGKGTIAPGSDADLVIFNHNRKETIGVNNPVTHHMNVDHNAFEGIEAHGVAEIVLSRGEVVVKDNKFLGKVGRGNFIKRGTFQGLKVEPYYNF
ncbi:dihydropyrimidinase [Candidatus Riflebacteria bacterium]